MAVVHFESFAAAARQLHVVPSVVAKRIAQLEKEVGVTLFERTTRTMKITNDGLRLAAKARVLIEQFDELVEDVQRDKGQLEGNIRLMLPTTLSMLHLDRVVAEFLAQHEKISIEAVLADRSASPIESGFDVMISGRTAHYDGVAQIPLAPIHVVLCASKAYLAKHPPIRHPSDLAEHACLVFSPYGPSWTFESKKGTLYVDVTPRLTADDNKTLCIGVEKGLGVALLPYYSAQAALESGEVVTLLDDYPTPERWYNAYVPKRKLKHARIEALCETMREALHRLPKPPQLSE